MNDVISPEQLHFEDRGFCGRGFIIVNTAKEQYCIREAPGSILDHETGYSD
jgi:hypothetical protein